MTVENWTNITSTAVTDTLSRAVGFIPDLIGALIVILIGVVVAWAAKTVIVKVLSYIKIKPYLEKAGLSKALPGKVDFAALIGDLVQWIIIIAFLLPALDILNLSQVNELLSRVISYIPNVIVAVALVMIGAIVADLVAKVVESAAQTIGVSTAKALADIAKYAIIIFVILASLYQLGIAAPLIDRLFTAVVGMVAIAGGLAFGLGGQEAAKDAVNRLRKNLPK